MFSSDPALVTIQEGAGLAENANLKAMVGSQCGGNTGLHAVFVRLLLLLAAKHRMPCEDMVKRLFVFSDMQFNQATGTWEDVQVEGWEWMQDQDIGLARHAH